MRSLITADYGNSYNFLLGAPTEQTVARFEDIGQDSPIEFLSSPLLWLSPPRDHIDQDPVINYAVSFVVKTFAFRYNPNPAGIKATEFVVYWEPAKGFETLYGDLRIDTKWFSPYSVLAYDPMQSTPSRRWCASVGNTLIGDAPFQFNLYSKYDPELVPLFNPAAFRGNDEFVY